MVRVEFSYILRFNWSRRCVILFTP